MRGLGPAQLRALDIIEREGPIAVLTLAERLGLSERRTRKVVESLETRRYVRVRREDGEPIDGAPRRHRRFVATPSQMSEWLRNEALRKAFLHDLRRAVYEHSVEGVCVGCGQSLPKTPRPVI
jgi:DNA-binding MarR family transcriptional regulator